jgi:hypothetical protein
MSGELNKALAAAQAEFPDIPKDKVNPHFKSKYASLDSMLSLTRGPLSKNGLATSFRTSEAGLECVLLHQSGESITSGPIPLLVQKNDMQGYGSSVTYAKRYSFGCVTGISPDEDDDGNAAAAAAPKGKATAPTRPPAPTKPVTPPANRPAPKEELPSVHPLAAMPTPTRMVAGLKKALVDNPVGENIDKWKLIYSQCLLKSSERMASGEWKEGTADEVIDQLGAIKDLIDSASQMKEALSV